ncbi:MAG: YeeE/YedE family protein, partial [Gammaproteobacteria bacterium]|nr:YeeE/YedE family protein [Gammaproteobacteria bacterium]
MILAFAFAFVLGAVAHKTNFCTMGAISDWINMSNTSRLAAWMFSIAIAIL